ncbi:hypothetical protein Ahia01_001247100 [Argonauta hians]
MAKTWTDWESSKKEGKDVRTLLSIDPPKPDPAKDFSSSLSVLFDGKEFQLSLARLPPPSSLTKDELDVIATRPSIPFTELFSPLIIDPTPEDPTP